MYYVYVVIRSLNSAYPPSPPHTCIQTHRKFWLDCFRSAHMCICVCMCVNVCVHVYDFCIFSCVSVRLSHGMVYVSLCICCLTCAWNVKSIQVLTVVSSPEHYEWFDSMFNHFCSLPMADLGTTWPLTFPSVSPGLLQLLSFYALCCDYVILCCLHCSLYWFSFLTIYTLSCQCVRCRIHSSISPRAFEHESYQTEQRRHTVYTLLVCMQFPHHLYSKLPISWMQDKRRNASTSTALYIPLIL